MGKYAMIKDNILTKEKRLKDFKEGAEPELSSEGRKLKYDFLFRSLQIEVMKLKEFGSGTLNRVLFEDGTHLYLVDVDRVDALEWLADNHPGKGFILTDIPVKEKTKL